MKDTDRLFTFQGFLDQAGLCLLDIDGQLASPATWIGICRALACSRPSLGWPGSDRPLSRTLGGRNGERAPWRVVKSALATAGSGVRKTSTSQGMKLRFQDLSVHCVCEPAYVDVQPASVHPKAAVGPTWERTWRHHFDTAGKVEIVGGEEGHARMRELLTTISALPFELVKESRHIMAYTMGDDPFATAHVVNEDYGGIVDHRNGSLPEQILEALMATFLLRLKRPSREDDMQYSAVYALWRQTGSATMAAAALHAGRRKPLGALRAHLANNDSDPRLLAVIDHCMGVPWSATLPPEWTGP